MEFQDCKKKYDELMFYKRTEEDLLKQDKLDLARKKIRTNEFNNICDSLKKEINVLSTKYNEYSEVKFNSINNKLKILLWFLSLIGCIITFFAVGGGDMGLVFSLLIIAGSTLSNSIILIIYNFIEFLKPKWITRFWKKDEMFRNLETSIKNKEEELNKNLQLYELSTKNMECLASKISESESYIKELESLINDLLMSCSTRLFDDSVEKIDDTKKNTYIKVKKQ